MRRWGWLACLLALALPGGVGRAEELVKTVVATGVATGMERAQARDEALLDAQRRAVEQEMGLFIAADTLVVNLQLVRDAIAREVHGYIRAYRILSERYDAAQDLFRVTIEAEVALGALQERMPSLYTQLRLAGQPRVRVAVPGATAAMTAALAARGISVVTGTETPADLACTGTLTADPVERIVADPATYSQRVALDLQIIRAETGEVLAACRSAGTGAGFTEAEARRAAEARAVEASLQQALPALLRALLDPCKAYQVKVLGCSFLQLADVEKKLGEARFARRIAARFEEGYGVLTAEFAGTAQLLATQLATAPGIKVQVVGVTATTVTVKVQ